MSQRNLWRVLKLMALGAFSFWFPDILVHALRGFEFNGRDVLLISIVMPVTFLGAYFLAARLLKSVARRNVVWPLIAGVWLLGGLFMVVGASFSGGGFVGPNGFHLWDETKFILLSIVPPYTFIIAIYDGSLLALLVVTCVALVIALPAAKVR